MGKRKDTFFDRMRCYVSNLSKKVKSKGREKRGGEDCPLEEKSFLPTCVRVLD